MSTRPEKCYTILSEFKVLMKKTGLISKVLIAACFTLFAGMLFVLIAAAADGKSAISGHASCAVTPLMNEEFFPALLQAVDGASDEIFIAVFSFKAGGRPDSRPDQLLDHLARAVKRGVQVKVILENSGERYDALSKQNFRTKNLLEKRGVKVYMDSPKKTMHSKLVVVDQRLVFIGSHNFTPSALKHNDEMSVLIEKPDLAQNARNYMLTLIKEAP